MKKRKIYSLFFLVFMLPCLLAITVEATPAIGTSDVSQQISFSINLATSVDIRSYKIGLSYDPALISFESAEQGSLFDGYNVGWWQVDTETSGLVEVECIIFGAGDYTSGPGNILNVNFVTNLSGIAKVDFAEVILFDPDANQIQEPINTEPLYNFIGSNCAYFSAKCFLEGPFEAGQMNTELATYLPSEPANLQSQVSVSSLPDDMVDWVTIEIRNSPNGGALQKVAAILHSDGSISTPGAPCIVLWGIRPDDYYFVIDHRNHLPLLTSTGMQFSVSGDPIFYDMSLKDNIYGSTYKRLAATICGLIAGDADEDGNVYPSDCNENWRSEAGSSGYLSADFNLDGVVYPDDLNELWRINSGISSTIIKKRGLND